MDGTATRVSVAIISSVHPWNDTRIFTKQAASLAAAGYEVVLLAIGDHSAPFERSGVRVIPLRRRRRCSRWITWFRIARYVISARPSIVHAHDPELIPLTLFLRLAGRRTVCDIHENFAEQIQHKEWLPHLLRQPLAGLVKFFDRWLPYVTDAVILAEDSYRRNFPQAQNVVVVRNFPILPDLCKESYVSHTLRLIYVGDVRAVRGIREYIAVVDRLRRNDVPVELLIVGGFADSAEELQTRRMLRELGLTDAVKLLGRRPPDDVPRLLRQCDVGLALLHPIANYRESYPTKMFEYMAAGLPVVASNFPLWEDVLVPNDCGRVVDPFDIERVTAIVEEYWRRPELRSRHGRNGRRAVVARYNWKTENQRLIGLYNALERRRHYGAP